MGLPTRDELIDRLGVVVNGAIVERSNIAAAVVDALSDLLPDENGAPPYMIQVGWWGILGFGWHSEDLHENTTAAAHYKTLCVPLYGKPLNK